MFTYYCFRFHSFSSLFMCKFTFSFSVLFVPFFFFFATRYETVVLQLKRPPVLPPASALASRVLGRSTYLNWPLMHEAQVVGISDEKEVRKLSPLTHAEFFVIVGVPVIINPECLPLPYPTPPPLTQLYPLLLIQLRSNHVSCPSSAIVRRSTALRMTGAPASGRRMCEPSRRTSPAAGASGPPRKRCGGLFGFGFGFGFGYGFRLNLRFGFRICLWLGCRFRFRCWLLSVFSVFSHGRIRAAEEEVQPLIPKPIPIPMKVAVLTNFWVPIPIKVVVRIPEIHLVPIPILIPIPLPVYSVVVVLSRPCRKIATEKEKQSRLPIPNGVGLPIPIKVAIGILALIHTQGTEVILLTFYLLYLSTTDGGVVSELLINKSGPVFLRFEYIFQRAQVVEIYCCYCLCARSVPAG